MQSKQYYRVETNFNLTQFWRFDFVSWCRAAKYLAKHAYKYNEERERFVAVHQREQTPLDNDSSQFKHIHHVQFIIRKTHAQRQHGARLEKLFTHGEEHKYTHRAGAFYFQRCRQFDFSSFSFFTPGRLFISV